MSSTFFLLFLALLNLPSAIQARADDDTESINTSFDGQIKKHFFEKGRCEILVPVIKSAGDASTGVSISTVEWVEATTAVEPPYKLPTCLKLESHRMWFYYRCGSIRGNTEFYAQSHLSGCGKPMYNKFKYCAKALHFQNKDYNTIDFRQIYYKQRQILVLIDGCMSCPAWPEHAANVTINLLSRFGTNQTTTKSDRFGDFKIGEILYIKDKNVQSIQPIIEVHHYCNQYNMLQKKILKLPVLFPLDLRHLTFESTITTIPLYQKDQNEVIVPL